MNILHVITHYDPVIYGAENFAKHVVEHQVLDEKNKVWVITGWWDDSWKGEEVINGVNVVRVKCSKIRYIQTLLATIPLYFKASEVIKQNKVDVIHTHIYPGMLVGYLLSLRFSIPNVATIQGGDIGDYDEVFGPFKGVAKMLIGFCLRRSKRVHCVSTYLASEIEKMGIDKQMITVIPNGVDTIKFNHPSSNIKNESKEIKIISTSRLEEKNNLATLIGVVNELTKKGYILHLDLYGTGSLKSELSEEIKQLRLGKNVELKGYIKQEELSQKLHKYDLFVRLSKQEGFGISFIEAMASGVVTVGTSTGGIVDIIEHKKNGYLVDLETDLVEQLELILKDGVNWDSLQKAARQKVERVFDWIVVLPKVNKLYE